ncbi:hypothetical protein V1527DRAFT_499237 [Lipomyces starkeyi]
MNCIAEIASSTDSGDQEKQLAQPKNDYPTESANYFLDQWWADGQRGCRAEIHICKNVNLGINTTSRVGGSHGAMKGALTSSKARSEQPSILSSNQNLIVRQDIHNQPETSNLCRAISRHALELVYSEVVKKQLRQGDESNNECSCATWNRYLLPCSHRIQLGVVHSVFPSLNVPWQQVDSDRLAVLKDPSAGHNKRKCPKVLNKQSQLVGESESMADVQMVDENASLEDHEGIFDDDENDADLRQCGETYSH